MKNLFLAVAFLTAVLSSCKKDSFNAAKQATTDDALIKAYIAANNINATKDPSGLYYEIETPGTGTYPTINSTVTVDYNGTLLNGYVFAPTSSLSSALTGLIKGWQIGIPFINKGGRILLIVPSALAYGNTSPSGSNIPVNSVLVFTIDLLSFSN